MTTDSTAHMNAASNAFILSKFVPNQQLKVMVDGFRHSEESEYFGEKLEEYATRVQSMHKTYEQDGKGDAILSPDYGKEHGRDGYVDLGQGGELGYVSIVELLQIGGVELDLHWEPKPLKEVK